jgi:hypothetical protein
VRIAGNFWVMSKEKAKKLAKEHGLIAVEYPVQQKWIFVRMDGEVPVVIATATYLEVDTLPERIISRRIIDGVIEDAWGDSQ